MTTDEALKAIQEFAQTMRALTPAQREAIIAIDMRENARASRAKKETP